MDKYSQLVNTIKASKSQVSKELKEGEVERTSESEKVTPVKK